jgi:hypothetical protein
MLLARMDEAKRAADEADRAKEPVAEPEPGEEDEQE